MHNWVLVAILLMTGNTALSCGKNQLFAKKIIKFDPKAALPQRSTKHVRLLSDATIQAKTGVDALTVGATLGLSNEQVAASIAKAESAAKSKTTIDNKVVMVAGAGTIKIIPGTRTALADFQQNVLHRAFKEHAVSRLGSVNQI